MRSANCSDYTFLGVLFPISWHFTLHIWGLVFINTIRGILYRFLELSPCSSISPSTLPCNLQLSHSFQSGLHLLKPWGPPCSPYDSTPCAMIQEVLPPWQPEYSSNSLLLFPCLMDHSSVFWILKPITILSGILIIYGRRRKSGSSYPIMNIAEDLLCILINKFSNRISSLMVSAFVLFKQNDEGNHIFL